MSNEPTTTNDSFINQSLLNIKAKMTAVGKDAKNPFFKSTYTTLNAFIQAVEPLLKEEGMFLTQPVSSNGQSNFVRTLLTHAASGENVESVILLPVLDDMQKLGGAITYARRYTLASLLGMMSDDDDGNTATGKTIANKPIVKVANSSNF